MEHAINSILMYIGAVASLSGIVLGIAITIYYNHKISGKKKLTSKEFHRGIILIAITSFVIVAGLIIPRLIIIYINSEPVPVPLIIIGGFGCLGGFPMLGIGTFIWEFRRKGWVE